MANILLVEDDRTTAKMVSYYLNAIGHKITETLNVPQALEVLKTNTFDIIMSDVHMEPTDGITFARGLRETGVETPIIMASAAADVQLVKNARQAGVDDFLTKPIKPEELRKAIDNILTQPFLKERTNRKSSKAGEERITLPEKLKVRLEQLLPGDFYADSRDRLHHLLERPRVIIEAEPGLLSDELFDAIHQHGNTGDGPLKVLHMGKLSPETGLGGLFDENGRLGEWFTETRGGTLVLMEIERLPAIVQSKLNTCLRSHKEGRIIITVARDPEALCSDGLLDEGLHFRFATGIMRLPPVRECGEGLERLFESAVKTSRGYVFGSVRMEIEEAVVQAVRSYPWNGNVSELRVVAAWAAGRMRTPQLTIAQLPERFMASKLPTLAGELLRVQSEHLSKASRLYKNPLQASNAMGISLELYERALQVPPEPVFHIEEHGRKKNRPKEITDLSILLIMPEQILRATAKACIPAKGIKLMTVSDSLEAIAQLAVKTDEYGWVVQAGSKGLFGTVELGQQLKRIAPRIKFGVIMQGAPENPLIDYRGEQPETLQQLESHITQMLLLQC